MHSRFGKVTSAAFLFLLQGCASEPVDRGRSGGGESGSGENHGSAGGPANACSGALKQSAGLVDEVAATQVAVLERAGAELTLFVDATAGGADAKGPWIYLSLADGSKQDLTDFEALASTAWDLAFKRATIRTNGGDSGPGRGGSFRVALPWDSVNASTLGDRSVPTEKWFDEECNLTVDESTGSLITTFSGWDEYDQATHVLTPADAVYLTQGASGALYKVAILDYYADPDGGSGRTSARYKLRVAALP